MKLTVDVLRMEIKISKKVNDCIYKIFKPMKCSLCDSEGYIYIDGYQPSTTEVIWIYRLPHNEENHKCKAALHEEQ